MRRPTEIGISVKKLIMIRATPAKASLEGITSPAYTNANGTNPKIAGKSTDEGR